MLQELIAPPDCKPITFKSADEISNEIIFHAKSSAMCTHLCDAHSPDRPDVEKFIQRIFRQAHGANVKHFMPRILCLRDSRYRLQAVSGMRQAEHENLFLERYLDKPVQDMIAFHSGSAVLRHRIVEIGNLAVENPLYTRLLLAALGRHLYSTDTEWFVFSALPSIIRIVARTNHTMLVLGDARLDCLAPEDRADWGSYYQHRPKVIALRWNTLVNARN